MMKTIIRSKIKVGAHFIETVFIKNPEVGNLNCWGTYDQQGSRIEIKTALPNPKKEETWIHEIIHAISMDRGIGLSEKQVSMVAPAIYCFLVDNGYLKR